MLLRLGPSPQLGQQKQERALALLRQRAELEVWETQKALDQLLRKHRPGQPGCTHSLRRAARPACPSEPAALLRQMQPPH